MTRHFVRKKLSHFAFSSNRITCYSSCSNCPTPYCLTAFSFLFCFFPMISSIPSFHFPRKTSLQNITYSGKIKLTQPQTKQNTRESPVLSKIFVRDSNHNDLYKWLDISLNTAKTYLLLNQRCNESIMSWMTYTFLHMVKSFFFNFHVFGHDHSQNN